MKYSQSRMMKVLFIYTMFVKLRLVQSLFHSFIRSYSLKEVDNCVFLENAVYR